MKQSANRSTRKASSSSPGRVKKQEELMPPCVMKQETETGIKRGLEAGALSATISTALEEGADLPGLLPPAGRGFGFFPAIRSKSRENQPCCLRYGMLDLPVLGYKSHQANQTPQPVVSVKRETSPDTLPQDFNNHPEPVGLDVNDAVTVRQESQAAHHLTPEEKEAQEQLWRSVRSDHAKARALSDTLFYILQKLSKKVKAENLRFDLNVLWSRLVTAKIPPDLFPIALDREIRDVCVSRNFMSKTWGGNTQRTLPKIGKKFNHGLKDFMYPGPDSQPGAPEVPGAPGLWLDVEDTEGTWWRNRYGDTPMRVFTRVMNKPSLWQYQGQYRVRIAETLSAEEWRQQTAKVSLLS
jgi:hypothetical protein